VDILRLGLGDGVEHNLDRCGSDLLDLRDDGAEASEFSELYSELTDGTSAADDDYGLRVSSVLRASAVFPRREEACAAGRVPFFKQFRSRSRQAERDRCSLVEREVVWNLSSHVGISERVLLEGQMFVDTAQTVCQPVDECSVRVTAKVILRTLGLPS